MHLGHYFGTMHSWKTIQDMGIDTWILVADYQVITDRDALGPLRERVLSLVADTLAVGVDPVKTLVFLKKSIRTNNIARRVLGFKTPNEMVEKFFNKVA